MNATWRATLSPVLAAGFLWRRMVCGTECMCVCVYECMRYWKMKVHVHVYTVLMRAKQLATVCLACSGPPNLIMHP